MLYLQAFFIVLLIVLPKLFYPLTPFLAFNTILAVQVPGEFSLGLDG